MSQNHPPCPLLSLPAELHLEILSYIPTLADQISASIAYPPWSTLISKTDSLKRQRYTPNRPWKSAGLHNLLSPTHYHTFFGITAKSGIITSYSLYTFDRLHNTWHEELQRVVRYRASLPHRYGPGKRIFEDDDQDLGVNRRDYTNFSKLLRKIDISGSSDSGGGCEFLIDETLFSPFLTREVIEEDWKLPLDLSYNNDRIEWTLLGKMVLQGFPISFRSTECGLIKNYRDFYTIYVPETESSLEKGLTLRRIAEIAVNKLQEKIPFALGTTEITRLIGPLHPYRENGLMKSEGLDPEEEHIILFDENWYKTSFHDGEMGVAVFILPCDDHEKKMVTKYVLDREDASKRMWLPRIY
ncbi:hypothetical protein TWF106_006381 [Orbilia oligospora]|uniref:F-box domain-containing protein n=1 Tax=Orbilia oligospora TaxID=2813651 RepID=A0A7C8V492_ORBOL|nr:hypothetical protein TWF106_006381 [Orbilia oligospora]